MKIGKYIFTEPKIDILKIQNDSEILSKSWTGYYSLDPDEMDL